MPPTGSSVRSGIDDRSAAEILPHEQTLPKAKSDRLDLLAATRANLSPIWGLSLTAGPQSTPSSARTSPGSRPSTAEGSATSCGSSRTSRSSTRSSAAVAASPVVLADGHHRFETARTYRERRSDDPGADLVMALIVELSPEQLEVGPIHRALSGLPDGLDLVDVCSSWFDLTRVGDFDDRTTSALGESGSLALLMPSGTWLLYPKDGTAEAAGSDLDSSMVALVIAELPDHELAYVNSWQEGVRAVADDKAQARAAAPTGLGGADRRVGPTPGGACPRRPPTSAPSRPPAWCSGPSTPPGSAPHRRPLRSASASGCPRTRRPSR